MKTCEQCGSAAEWSWRPAGAKLPVDLCDDDAAGKDLADLTDMFGWEPADDERCLTPAR